VQCRKSVFVACYLLIVVIANIFSLQKITIYPNQLDFSFDSFYSIQNYASDFFTDDIFSESYQKDQLIFRIKAFYQAYKKNFYKVELIKDLNDFDVIFYLDINTKYYLKKGEITSNIKKYLPSIYKYPKGNKRIDHSGLYFYNENYFSFFYDIYGKTQEEVQNNCEDVDIFGKILPFNKKNDASLNLKRAISEILEESNDDQELKNWISLTKNIFTYSSRKVATENRPSLHSFAIAVDFLPKKYSKNMYWLWSSYFTPEWWNIPDSEKVHIPQKVIRIFEKYGFCWGGKWFRFDIMHFEYRPEILYYEMRD